MAKQKIKKIQKLSKEAESIKSFEKIHKKQHIFNEDGSLNDEGFQFLNYAEVHWGEDPKWHDHEKFHTQPRLEDYWFGEGEESDNEYWEFWCELHPNGTMEI